MAESVYLKGIAIDSWEWFHLQYVKEKAKRIFHISQLFEKLMKIM